MTGHAIRVPPPPPTPAGDTVDVLRLPEGAVEVADPYRWLEDASSPETVAWVAAQNERTRAVLDALPGRPGWRRRLEELFRAGQSGSPAVRAGTVFSLDRWGDRDQAVLVRRPLTPAELSPSEGELVLDPVELTGDETATIDWYAPSRDARLVAYGMSAGGDERSTLRVHDVATGTDLHEEIPHTRAASVGWFPDGSGFLYTRYSKGGDYDRHVFRHRLGEPWAQDAVVFDALPDPTAWPDVSVSRDGRRAVIHVALGWSRVDVHLLDLQTHERHTLIEAAEAVTWFGVDEERERLVGWTTLDAERGRVVSVDVDGPWEPAAWQTLVPEGDDVIESVAVTPASLLVATTRRAVSHLRRYSPDGADAAEIPLPESGSLAGLAPSRETEAAIIGFTSFVRPPELWRWGGDHAGLRRWSELPGRPDTASVRVEQVTYPSNDGTEIPMFLISPASRDGSGRHDDRFAPQLARSASPTPRPTILNGYGGFAVTMSPAYSPLTAAWVEAGGLVAVACLRGGAEEGEVWHRAGMRERKQQVFDDFHAAADWLVEQGLTTRGRLGIRGGSNGGLLVAAAATQRPDLCRAVVCAVPLTDMVRYPEFLIAKLWIPEYGDPAVPEELRWLLAYSPYHHVVEGECYPAVLVETGEEDSRVDPCHARKFAARLQAATSCGDDRPVLVRIESRAGHGQGKPAGRQADEAADVASFLAWQLGVEP